MAFDGAGVSTEPNASAAAGGMKKVHSTDVLERHSDGEHSRLPKATWATVVASDLVDTVPKLRPATVTLVPPVMGVLFNAALSDKIGASNEKSSVPVVPTRAPTVMKTSSKTGAFSVRPHVMLVPEDHVVVRHGTISEAKSATVVDSEAWPNVRPKTVTLTMFELGELSRIVKLLDTGASNDSPPKPVPTVFWIVTPWNLMSSLLIWSV